MSISKNNKHKKLSGFSLLELLIVIVILSILAGVAVPAYRAHLITVRRVDGRLGLLKLAVTLTEKSAEKNSDSEKNLVSPHEFYQLKILAHDLASNNFTIIAIPLGSQKQDKTCGILALDSMGQKGRLNNNQIVLDKRCF